MKTLRKPTVEQIRVFLEAQGQLDFSYEAVGATRGTPPAGYTLDHTRIKLGVGEAVFEKARDVLIGWQQFRIGWVEIMPGDAEIRVGGLCAVVARKVGIWWSNACRIIYVIDREEPTRKFGFGYGTLPDHAGSGEERFEIEWNPETDEVFYDIIAFSRPHLLATRIAYPYMRHAQKRFGLESAAQVMRLVGQSADTPILHESAWT